jgi:hypothetical protein
MQAEEKGQGAMNRHAPDRKTTKRRKEYLEAKWKCLVPGCLHRAVCIHEIARGAHRKEAFKEPAAWLALCMGHHWEMDDYHLWPIVRQLALKKVSDSINYDRLKVNALRSRAPEAITEEEVDAQVKTLQ